MCTFYILRFILIWILTQCILILTIFVSTLLQMLYWMSLNLKVRYTFTKRLAKTNKNSPLFLNTYFCYKTITSQNVSLGVQVWNFFVSQKSYVPFSRYSSFRIFNHLMNYQICDVMSVSTCDRVHLFNHNSLSHLSKSKLIKSQLVWLINISEGNNF